MAGLEKLKEKIIEEAHLTVQSNIDRARHEASEILESASNEADKKQKEIIEKAYKDAEDRKKRIKAYTELEGRKKRLEAKQDMVDATFNKVIGRLNSLPIDEYRGILIEMVVKLVETGDEEIILSKKDKESIGVDIVKVVNERLKSKGLKSEIRLADESVECNGGFILKAGDVETNNTFETMIRVRREHLEAEVVKALFKH